MSGNDQVTETVVTSVWARLAGFFEVNFRLFLLIIMPLYALYCLGWLTNGHFNVFNPLIVCDTCLGLTFNSMLDHLLRGEFDVDPRVIGVEAYVSAGKSYAYFGILPALLRLPLLPLGWLGNTDITGLSCVAAALTAVFFKLRSVLAVTRVVDASPAQAALVCALVLAVLFGSFEVQSLRTTTYQEVVYWADAIAAAFVYCAVRGLVVEHTFSPGLLSMMAVIAGLELLTRVSTAIGLFGAMGLLLLTSAWRELRADTGPDFVARLIRVALAPRIVAPAAILLGFALLMGLINYERYGDPLTTMDQRMRVYEIARHPDRLSRVETYGEINPARLWYGLLYYFAPIWAIVLPDHRFLFQDFSDRMFDGVEAPPGSLLLSEPLLIVLSIVVVVDLLRRSSGVARGEAVALLVGLSLPGLLVASAIFLAFRYRVEFMPLLELAALLGFYAIAREPARFPWLGGDRGPAVFLLCSLWSVLAAHYLMLTYKLSVFGPSEAPMGWLRYYYWQLVLRGLN